MRDLIADGNSVVLVDHDTKILAESDWLIEMGPDAGAKGGRVVAQGSVADIEKNPDSKIGKFLSGKTAVPPRKRAAKGEVFGSEKSAWRLRAIHTVKPASVEFPKAG